MSGNGGHAHMRPHMRIARLATVLAAAALLGGCVKLGPKAPSQLINLTPARAAPAGAIASGRVVDAIVVLDPDTDRRLDVQRVPVQVDPATVAYVKNAQWVERPARLFRRLLAETLRAKGQRLVLEGGDTEAGGKLILSGRLLDMGYDAASRSVVVRYDALRSDSQGTVQARRFEAVVPGVKPAATAIAPALNQAANDVAGQVADWIG